MSGCVLVGDIGGTNARFALARDGVPHRVETLESASYKTLDAALDAYLQGQQVSAASLAVAAPVSKGMVELTNSDWSFTKQGLEAKLRCEVEIVNDFAALARAIPFLSAQDYQPIPGKAGSARQEVAGTIAIIGPGTGLGIATLIRAGEHWIDLAGEGGHVTMAPATPEEDRLIGILRNHWEHVSAERFLSGAGLVALYEACCELRGLIPAKRSAAEITSSATTPAQDPDAWVSAHAFDVFCAMLGTVASNLALTVGATGGVYIAGGILRRFPEFLAGSRFRYRFEQKGRMSAYLRDIPTFLIVNQTPALIGLANWGRARPPAGAAVPATAAAPAAAGSMQTGGGLTRSG